MRPVFVIGPSRSGTTLLASRIGSVQGGIAAPELQFIYDLFETHSDTELQRLDAPQVLDNLRRDYSFCNLRLKASQIEDIKRSLSHKKETGLIELLESLLRQYAIRIGRREHLSLFVEHSPIARKYVNSIVRTFPDAQFIGIYRDPRAVYCSLKNLSWGPRTPAYFTIWWKNAILELLLASAYLKDKMMLISFEKLLVKPEESLRSICAFLDLDFSVDILRGSRFVTSNYTLDQHKKVSDAIDVSVSTAWRNSISKKEVAIIESRCSQAMKIFDYQPISATRISRLSFLLNISPELVLSYFAKKRQTYRRKKIVEEYNQTL